MASVGGLVSGLDTATIIRQLMQIEALPQTALRSRVSTQERQVTALQTLNSKFASIATRAAELTNTSGWSPTKTTSSNEHVTVKADAGTNPTSLSFDVTSVATTSNRAYTTTGTLDAVLLTPGADPAVPEFLIKHGDGTEKSLDIGDGTLESIAKAVNADGTGLKATLIKTGVEAGTDKPIYQLHVTSAVTGSSSDFSIVDAADPANTTAFLGGPTSSTDGLDASITVNGQVLTSSTNTFEDLTPGVDVTLGAKATGTADIAVTRDTKSLADKVKSMVDAVNSALGEISSLTAYDPATKTAGLLSGDSGLRSIRSELLSTITTGIDGTSLASVGIQVDKTGKLTFDSAKFTEAYEADPTGTAAKFTGTLSFAPSGSSTGTVELYKGSWRTAPGTYSVNANADGGTIDGATGTLSGSILTGAAGTRVEGLAVRYTGEVNGTVTYTRGIAAKLEALAQRASDSTSGTVTASIQGRTSRIERMNDDIENWDVRLDLRRTSLERTYAALEVAMGKMQNQSNWLAGQLASLPSYSSGN